MPSSRSLSPSHPVNIVHIKASSDEASPSASGLSLLVDIIKGLTSNQKYIPTVVLYDENGLKIYDQITNLKEYYPFEAELCLLKKHGLEIVEQLCANQNPNQQRKFDNETSNLFPPNAFNCTQLKEKWGDYSVGKENDGVNGNLGLNDKQVYSKNVVFFELGAGSLRKTVHLLEALHEFSNKSSATSSGYYAIDLEYAELVKTLRTLTASSDNITTNSVPGKIRAQGICASYEEAKPFISEAFNGRRKCFLWLGSSIGNFERGDAVEFLKSYVATSFEPGDTLLLGVDCCQDGEKVKAAYDDKSGVTKSFILNGLKHVELILGLEPGQLYGNFEYDSRWNSIERRHEAYIRPIRTFSVDIPNHDTKVEFHKDESIAIEKSHKYSQNELSNMFDQIGLRLTNVWSDEIGYTLVTAQKVKEENFNNFDHEKIIKSKQQEPNFAVNACPNNIPNLEDWKKIWSIWDDVTLKMVPKELLHTRPIDLRHIILFYLGHIPAFADIFLSRHFEEPFTEPAHFPEMFERGIDPDMDDPTKIHDHSIVPDSKNEWPTLDELVDYRNRVEKRIQDVYESKVLYQEKINRRLCRVLVLLYEHQAMHLETLLYMLLQISDKINDPPNVAKPDWNAINQDFKSKQQDIFGESDTPILSYTEETKIMWGHDDDESHDEGNYNDQEHVYGWDNESPVQEETVAPFKISAMPITNGDYATYLEDIAANNTDDDQIPSSWVRVESKSEDENNKDIRSKYNVRAFFQPGWVPFEVAKNWPLMASGKILQGYAEWKGGRLPSAPELRVFLNEHSTDSDIGNTDFRHWHPVAASYLKNGNRNMMSNGGVWEWTSSKFESYPGFKPSKLYPGYSADFFDGCHNIILGGSWATLKKLSDRPSFVNWYQFKYPYVFAGGRVAYSV